LVPFVSPAGGIATQAHVSTDIGRRGMALLEQGVPIGTALQSLPQDDADLHIRHVHGVASGGSFFRTAADCVPWCGRHDGGDFTVAGNMLAGSGVLEAMFGTYRRAREAKRALSDRLFLTVGAG